MKLNRLLLPLALAALAGCHDSPGEPVTTVDGQWSGVQNGYSLSFNLTQADTLTSGGVVIASTGGSFGGTASGTFKYPALHLTITIPGFDNATYDGTMSSTEAKIFGKLNGSGLNNVEVDVVKK
jgi:hypothetical protein